MPTSFSHIPQYTCYLRISLILSPRTSSPDVLHDFPHLCASSRSSSLPHLIAVSTLVHQCDAPVTALDLDIVSEQRHHFHKLIRPFSGLSPSPWLFHKTSRQLVVNCFPKQSEKLFTRQMKNLRNCPSLFCDLFSSNPGGQAELSLQLINGGQ